MDPHFEEKKQDKNEKSANQPEEPSKVRDSEGPREKGLLRDRTNTNQVPQQQHEASQQASDLLPLPSSFSHNHATVGTPISPNNDHTYTNLSILSEVARQRSVMMEMLEQQQQRLQVMGLWKPPYPGGGSISVGAGFYPPTCGNMNQSSPQIQMFHGGNTNDTSSFAGMTFVPGASANPNPNPNHNAITNLNNLTMTVNPYTNLHLQHPNAPIFKAQPPLLPAGTVQAVPLPASTQQLPTLITTPIQPQPPQQQQPPGGHSSGSHVNPNANAPTNANAYANANVNVNANANLNAVPNPTTTVTAGTAAVTVTPSAPPSIPQTIPNQQGLTLQDNPNIAPVYNGVNPNYPNLRVIHQNPPIFCIPSFLTPTECDFLICIAQDCLTPAPVVGKGAGEVTPSRTSSTCYLAREDLPVYMNKISLLTGKPVSHCELPQVGRYFPTQQYMQHFDAFDLSNEDGRRFASNGGQRTVTVLTYLNDVHEGGHTAFPTLNLEVKPQRGMAIVFFPATVDGLLDKNALHAAKPAVDTKYVSQVWIRQGDYDGVPSKRMFSSVEQASIVQKSLICAREGSIHGGIGVGQATS